MVHFIVRQSLASQIEEERAAGEAICHAELIDQILQIRRGHEIGPVNEKDEFGRRDLHLRHVVDAQPFACEHGRVDLLHAPFDELIQGAGPDALKALLIHFANRR